MEKEWRLDVYKPTVSWVGFEAPDVADLPELSSKVQAATKSILDAPYCVEYWSTRSDLLSRLGYPELAVGDAYKVRLLVDAVESKTSDLGNKVISAHREFVRSKKPELDADSIRPEVLRSTVLDLYELESWMRLVCCLSNCRTSDCLDVCREALAIHPDHEGLLQWRELIEEHLGLKVQNMEGLGAIGGWDWMSHFRSGRVYMRQYPWITMDELQRSDSLVEKLNSELMEASEEKCTIARSPVISDVSTTDELGIFAAQDIKDGDRVMLSYTPIATSNDVDGCPTCSANLQHRPSNLEAMIPSEPCRIPCCNEQYCSSKCADVALQTFHPPICTKDFSFLIPVQTYHPSGDSWPLVSRVFLRSMATAVHENTHPLYTTLLSRLKASYDGDHMLIFNFLNIKDAFRILQALNIDIFADLRFDTWVLHTIQCRIANNKAGGYSENGRTQYVNVDPLYCFFNHSCEPTCLQTAEIGYNTSLVYLVAGKDIKKGEEIFTSYLDGADLNLPWLARQEELYRWIRRRCQCPRCISDAQLSLRAARRSRVNSV